MAKFNLTALVGGEPHPDAPLLETPARRLELSGRAAWALRELVEAGAAGLTTLDRPAPRWSHYVWLLRHQHGVQIETEHEPHGGPFSGHHARYRLTSRVVILDDEEMAA